MLIKASRIRTSAGAGALARHLTDTNDNEAISVLRGTIADLHDAVADAKRFNRVYALRHFIIAPEIAVSHQQFERAAKALGDEFDFDPVMALVVEHQKPRALEGAVDRHWHVVVAETNAATGKVLSSSFSHPRHEKIARLLELEFAHPIVAGAHDKAVLAALRGEGHGVLADRLANALGQSPKPVAAYTTEAHQSGKRNGVDLAQARQHVRSAWAASINGDDFHARLNAHGLALGAGDKVGVVVIRDIATGSVLGAANRFAGVRRAEFNTFFERKHHDHDEQPRDRRTVDPHGHAGAAAGHGNDSGTGSQYRSADGGGKHVGAGRHGESAADHHQEDGAGGSKPRGTASEAGSASDNERLAAHDRHRLTEAVYTAAVGILALSKVCVSLSPAERVQEHLAAQEQQARARLAAAETKATAGVSNQLHAARLYKQAAEARYAKVLKSYRAAQEREAALPPPRRTAVDWLLGREAQSNGSESLQREIAALHADLVAADRIASGASGNLARVERAEAAARVQHMAQVETERRAATDLLGEVVMAQRLAKASPLIVYCGPAFAVWAGGKVEWKRRRGLRNPQAVNIWGIPLDFG